MYSSIAIFIARLATYDTAQLATLHSCCCHFQQQGSVVKAVCVSWDLQYLPSGQLSIRTPAFKLASLCDGQYFCKAQVKKEGPRKSLFSPCSSRLQASPLQCTEERRTNENFFTRGPAYSTIPTTNDLVQKKKWKLSRNAWTLHTRLGVGAVC